MDSSSNEPRAGCSDKAPWGFLSPLLLTLCSGIAQDAHLDHDQEIVKIFCVRCNEYHPRSAETAYAFAVAYRTTKDERYLILARRLARWLLSTQRDAGYWVESKHDARTWRGCTVHALLSLCAAYLLIGDELDRTEQDSWKAAIIKATNWVQRYDPTSHLWQTLLAIRYCLPNDAHSTQRHLRRTLNLNYVAEIPLGLQLSAMVTGDSPRSEALNRFLSYIRSRVTQDYLLTGEDADWGSIRGENARWGKFVKVFRKTAGIDIGYNFLSLAVLALYARLANDGELLLQTYHAANTHLQFFYPNGTIDNGQGARGEKCVPSAINMHLLCAVLSEFDSRFERVSRCNANALIGCLSEGRLSSGPYLAQHERALPCNYDTLWRTMDIAFAIHFGADTTPKRNELLLHERRNGLAAVKSLNTVVLKRDRIMVTVSGNRYRSSHLPYRQPLSPTGGSITMLYLQDYGPVQVSSFIGPHSVTPRIETVSTRYCSAHDLNSEITVADGIIRVRGHLSSRWRSCKRYPFEVELELGDLAITKRIRILNLGSPEPINIIEPLVMHREFLSYGLSDNRHVVCTDRFELSLEFAERDCVVFPWSKDPQIIEDRALRVWPCGVTAQGSNEITVETRIALRRRPAQAEDDKVADIDGRERRQRHADGKAA